MATIIEESPLGGTYTFDNFVVDDLPGLHTTGRRALRRRAGLALRQRLILTHTVALLFLLSHFVHRAEVIFKEVPGLSGIAVCRNRNQCANDFVGI
jgi:hypothetical protein